MEEIQVVSRNAIPPLQSLEQHGVPHELGELRDFRWNTLLRNFMPAPSRFSVRWVRLERGEVFTADVHGAQSLMVFYAGSGTLLGDLEGPVVKDDVVVVPAASKYGVVGGPDGLHALSIELGEGVEENQLLEVVNPEHTLSGLLAYNDRRLEEFTDRPLFELLSDGTIDDPLKRRALFSALKIWTDANEALLFSRQACCADPKYATAFLRDIEREFAHGREREAGVRRTGAVQDPTLEAIVTWFTHQMVIADNAEKAAIQLVINGANGAYRAAAPRFSSEQWHGATHVEPGTAAWDLLRDQSPRTYARLLGVLGEAWDMVYALSDRVLELVTGQV